MLADILQAAKSWRQPTVLGTVVDVRGAAYRRPGARMLIGADGRRVGMISGGCLEKEVVRHAFAWTEPGPAVVEFDTRADELRPAGQFGTGCDGIVHVLLEQRGRSRIDPLEEIAAVWASRVPRVLATIYDGPHARIGQRVVWDNGLTRGDDLSSLEDNGLYLAAASQWSRPRGVRAGEVTALVEPIRPPLDLLIVGAGDDAQALAAMAEPLGWHVRVACKWPTLVTRERFPQAAQLTAAPPEELLAAAGTFDDTVAVLMTHSLNDDAIYLAGLAGRVEQVMLLGPRSRTRRIVQTMARSGTLPAATAIGLVQTPAGLDLGGDTPAEVAASIVAGIIASRNRRDGGFLAHRDGPIHAEHERMVVDA